MKRLPLAIAALVLFGFARLPFEQQLDTDQRLASFRSAKLDLSLREQIGQMGFLAALSGFRSLVAAILWIDAHTAWENTEWGRMAAIFNTVTTLQPRSPIYWDMAGWHMGWNASAAAINDPEQPSEILRHRAQSQYFELGRKFLDDGVKNNPDDPTLRLRLGDILRVKFEDHCAAAKAYADAANLGAPPFAARFAAYELAQCPERDREAYDLLLKLYHKGADERTPPLVRHIRELEEKLGIPPQDRIPDQPNENSNPQH
jgi:hypothetical protein